MKNTAWLGLGEAGGRFLRIVLIFYSARVMSVAEWGLSSYILSWAVLFTIMTDIGLGSIVTRELVEDRERRARYVSTFFFLKLFLIAVAACAIVFLVPLISALPVSRSMALSLSLLVLFDSMRIIASVVNKSRETMHLEALMNIVTQAMILGIGFAILRYMPSAEGLNIAYAIGSAIGTLCGFYIIRDHLPGIFTSFEHPLAVRLVKDALPIAIVGLMGSLMLNTDIIMLGWMRTAEEIAYYSAAQKIIFTLYVLPTLAATSLFPSMVRLVKDAAGFKAIFEKSARNMLLAALPITVGGLVLGPELMELFYGSAYLPASAPFAILLLTVPVVFAANIVNNALIVQNRQGYFTAYAAIGFMLNIMLNLAFIPFLGISGAALSTLITETAASAYIWVRLNRLNGFSLPRGLGKGCVSTGVMALVAWAISALGAHVLVTITVSVGVYALALKILKEPMLGELTGTPR